jgi:hypothetical protein
MEESGRRRACQMTTGVFESFHRPGDESDTAADPVGFLGANMVGRRSFDFKLSVHESGHATVGRFLGQPIAGSTIEYTGNHFGATWDAVGPHDDGDSVADICTTLGLLMPGIGDDRSGIAVELQRAHNHILELLAGVEAERLFVGTMLPGTAHDLEEAIAIAALICRSPSSIDAYLAFARAEVVALLTDHRAVVLAVADALVERRILIGTEIDGIIDTALSLPVT